MKNGFSIDGILMLALCILCIAAIIFGLSKILDKAGYPAPKKQKIFFVIVLAILAWTGFLGIQSYNGFFSDFSSFPPRVVVALMTPLPFVLWFAFSKKGTALLKNVPPHWLVFMQSFRIIVELILWMAFLINILPVQMTFEGRNFDVLSGILALPVGYMLLKKKANATRLAIAFNIVGFLLLFNILAVALLSMPTTFRYFMNEPSNTLVAQFPYILLPGLLVPIAYTFHIFSLRQLLAKKQSPVKEINKLAPVAG
jgi:hypothetical protein